MFLVGNMIIIIFGVGNAGFAHGFCLLHHTVNEQVVFDVRIMRRRGRFNQEAPIKSVKVQKRQWRPFGNLFRNAARLRLCLIRVIPVQIKIIGIAPLRMNAPIRVIRINQQEEHML
ncbi:hypothetical protein D3C75_1145060 [compost metagenome]